MWQRYNQFEHDGSLPHEADLSFPRHPSMAFLYLGLTNGKAEPLPSHTEPTRMNNMAILRTHSYVERMQHRADTLLPPKQETVTPDRVRALIPTLRKEEQEILNAYFDGLNPEQEKDVFTRLNELCSMAEKTFAPLLRSFEGTPSDEQLQQFERKFFQWMALVMPYIGKKSAWLQQTETETGLINTNHSDHIWNSQATNRYLTEAELLQNKDLTQDVRGWQESGGLLIHTATAAWGIERIITIVQHNLSLMKNDGKTLNKHQENVLTIDGRIMRFWLLFHDAMRTLSHDAFTHAALLPLFGKLLGLPDTFLKDYDLPETLGFKSANPQDVNKTATMQEGLPVFKITREMRKDPQALLESGSGYVEKVLTLLKEKFPQEGPVESILFFWVVDAYSKLQPLKQLDSFDQRTKEHQSNFAFPSQEAVLAHLEQQLHNARLEEGIDDGATPSQSYLKLQQHVNNVRGILSALYRNPHFRFSGRQLDDTNDFLMGRLYDRKRFGSPNEQEMYNYYSRQNDMAFAIFDWMRLALDLNKKDIWKFFFELTEVSINFLDEDQTFQYQYHSEVSPFNWKTESSATEPKPAIRVPTVDTLHKGTATSADLEAVH